MHMFANAYNGKRIFITGHTGFKGSWLTAWLTSLGTTIAGFSLDVPSTPSHFEAIGLGKHIKDLRGDVRNRDAVKKAILEFQPDIVFHLAAQALVRRSYGDPETTFETNAIGTMNVLEAIRQTPSVNAAVIITSDKCYRNDEWVWGYRENDYLGGSDPYSASKACAELISHSYFDSFFKNGPNCATARAGNVIGGGDWATDRIVPDCARAWSRGDTVRIRSPHATRPWQLVLEPLSGYLRLGAALLHPQRQQFNPHGESYNFGPSATVNNTVAEVVEKLAGFWPGFSYALEQEKDSCMKECNLLKLCCDKALAHLDWKATLTFEETIRFTADWYRNYYANGSEKSRWNYTMEQIREYTNLAHQRAQEWAE